jgi:uncharacterized short protein YbdD (DUF466 family)
MEERRSNQYGAFRRKHPVGKRKTKDDYLREMQQARPRGESLALRLKKSGG